MNDTKIHAIMIVSIILSLAIVTAILPYTPDKSEIRLKSFTSYEELKDFITANSKNQNNYNHEGSGGPLISRFGLSNQLSTTDASTLPEYSRTNVQVEGVDEADIVKTDGTYIYAVSNQNIIILKAYPPENAEILSRIHFNGNIKGIFINNEKLAVFEDTSYYWQYRAFTEQSTFSYTPPKTSIKVYNIHDRANPTLIRTRNITVEGNYFNSRMIGNYAYILVGQPIYTDENDVTLPKISYSNKTETVPANQIYYTNITDKFNTYINVLAINLHNDHQKPTVKSYLQGYASTMYVSQNNIYLTYSTYNIQTQDQATEIHRINIDKSEIDYQASGKVPGYVLNQFSMDEYDSYFRIATTESPLRNSVYILNTELNTVGSLEDLAPGETLHSARFMGNRGYLVTFKKTDPLFVIDLTNPTNPQVLGQLKVTGYSDYLHPYDENHIIGIGKETQEAEEGNFAWYQGVKISLFDVTDVTTPREISKYEIGDRGTDSPILQDHKAFLFDKERSLLVLPVTVAEINPAQYPGEIPQWAFGEFVWDGAYIFNISLEQGLIFRDRITHAIDNQDQLKNGYSYLSSSIQRSLYIGNVLYTISEPKIKMNSLTDLTEINEIILNP